MHKDTYSELKKANHITVFFKVEYLEKELWDKINILHEDKNKILLRVDTIVFGERDQPCPDYPK